jgi:hypothetical protein
MNGWAIPGAYLFCLYVWKRNELTTSHRGDRHQPDWVVYVRDSEKFRLTNVIPERIIFVSRGITVLLVPLFPLPMCLPIFLVFILLLFWFWLLALVVKIWFGAVLPNSHLIFHSDHCSRPGIVGQGISLILSSIPMTPQGHFGLFNLW